MTQEQEFLKEHFLEPETRDGTYVSAELKAAWKVMLDLLEELIRICKKYNLRYSMEGGSLIGAMRHRGFIPWDDDVDVVLPRRDYDKLLRVIGSELPSHMFAQTTATDKEFRVPFLMLRDSRTTGIDRYHAEHGMRFNMGIRVDILPTDGMPTSGLLRRMIFRYALFWRGVVENAFRHGVLTWKGKIKSWIGRLIYFAVGGGRGVMWLRELPFRMIQMERCKYCASNPAHSHWVDYSVRETAWFDEYLEVPFEYLMVSVPRDYDKVLTQQFGEWKVPHKGGAYHGALIFDVNKDWRTSLVEKFGYDKKELGIK